MLPIATLAKRIRAVIHDGDKITYTDDDIVAVVNDGLRFIRRAIADIQPELISTEQTGVLEAGNPVIPLTTKAIAIIDVWAGSDVKTVEEYYGNNKIYHNYDKIYHNYTKIYSYYTITTYDEKRLKVTNHRHIQGMYPDERGKKGKPFLYYRKGMDALHLFPVPEDITSYTVMKVDDIEELSMDDVSPLPTEYDTFLIEYANIRLSIGNEYDVTQEQSVMANIYSQIQKLLYPPPPALQARGYWDDRRRGGYW